MGDISRIKFLMEYKFKSQNNDMETNDVMKFPSFDEYTKQFTEAENEEEPVDLDDDGLPVSLPPEGDDSANDVPVDMDTTDAGIDTGDSTDAVKDTFAGGGDMESNIDTGVEADPTNSYDFSSMEAKIDRQNSAIEDIMQNLKKINSFLPEPETKEDKIIKKLDSLEQQINDISNAEQIKKDIVRYKTPYSVNISDFYRDEPEPEQKEFVITPQDVDNYDKDEIKKSLGL